VVSSPSPVVAKPSRAPALESPDGQALARGVRGTSRPRRLTIGQAAAHVERLALQHRDTAPRGKGSKARKRAAALQQRQRGLSRTGKVVSKSQQRKFFADPALRQYAHQVAKRGAAFKALPERKRPPSVGSAR